MRRFCTVKTFHLWLSKVSQQSSSRIEIGMARETMGIVPERVVRKKFIIPMLGQERSPKMEKEFEREIQSASGGVVLFLHLRKAKNRDLCGHMTCRAKKMWWRRWGKDEDMSFINKVMKKIRGLKVGRGDRYWSGVLAGEDKRPFICVHPEILEKNSRHEVHLGHEFLISQQGLYPCAQALIPRTCYNCCQWW